MLASSVNLDYEEDNQETFSGPTFLQQFDEEETDGGYQDLEETGPHAGAQSASDATSASNPVLVSQYTQFPSAVRGFSNRRCAGTGFPCTGQFPSAECETRMFYRRCHEGFR